MKKFITILISCSLALAASAMAQQEEEQGKAKKGKDQTETSTPKPEGKPAGKSRSVTNEPTETKVPGQKRGAKTESAEMTPKPQGETKVKGKGAVNAETNANAPVTTGNETGVKAKRGHNARTEAATSTNAASPSASVNAQEQIGKGKRGQNARNANKTATPAPSIGAAAPSATVAPSASVAAGTQTTTNATANQTNVNAGANVNPGTNTGQIRGHSKDGKQIDQQTVQKIKTEHANFRAQPRPDKAPAVTFNQNYRISGAEQWQGPQYEVYRRYHPERHDRNWYHSHHNRIELISGGYYYWDNGYWYPAWGYDTSAEYYAYDAPIYVGHSADRRPDQVIADVQAALQQMGYYQGEVDGLIGPLTRQALVAYQSDNGLYATAVIDEPTLQSLDLG